jgi:hypothetical protein
MRRFIFRINTIIILSSLTWAIGLQGLTLPQSAQTLALSGSGIAGQINVEINPATILKMNDSNISFSSRTWFQDLRGSKFALTFGETSKKVWMIETMNDNNIELHDDLPSENSLGEFGVNWLSTSFTMGYQFAEIDFGVTIRGNYSSLYTESMYGVSTDFGLATQLSEKLQFGAIIKNLGYEYSENLSENLPILVGIGISVEPLSNLKLLSDIEYSDTHELVARFGIVKDWDTFGISAGAMKSDEEYSASTGFSFKYRRWQLKYGVSMMQTESLGFPQFFDIVWYF